MPRRTKLRRHASGWNDEHVRILKIGHDWFETFRDEIDQHEAWQALRSEILPQWLEEHPGSRPFGWWRFDAPERRRRIDGKSHPFDRTDCHPERRLYYGKPQMILREDLQARYESEHDYLARLSLLTVRELAILKGRRT